MHLFSEEDGLSETVVETAVAINTIKKGNSFVLLACPIILEVTVLE